jgi:hypothetical protein
MGVGAVLIYMTDRLRLENRLDLCLILDFLLLGARGIQNSAPGPSRKRMHLHLVDCRDQSQRQPSPFRVNLQLIYNTRALPCERASP